MIDKQLVFNALVAPASTGAAVTLYDAIVALPGTPPTVRVDKIVKVGIIPAANVDIMLSLIGEAPPTASAGGGKKRIGTGGDELEVSDPLKKIWIVSAGVQTTFTMILHYGE